MERNKRNSFLVARTEDEMSFVLRFQVPYIDLQSTFLATCASQSRFVLVLPLIG